MSRNKTYPLILYICFGILVVGGLVLVFAPPFFSLPDPKIKPDADSSIGMVSSIKLTFPESMNTNSVESRIQIIPETHVKFSWINKTLIIFPDSAFMAGKNLTIKLISGASSLDGRTLKSDYVWTYSIRSPRIAFLGQATTSPEIFLADGNGTVTKITETRGNIIDFAALPDGSGFVYSVKNSSGGSDIHEISIDSQKDVKILDCMKESCGDPAVSNDGHLMAFSWNHDPMDGSTSIRSYIYTMILDEGKYSPEPLAEEKNMPGILPSFSPDGKKIAFYDSIGKGIRVMIPEGKNNFLLGTSRIQRGTWSPDGSHMVFVDDMPGHDDVFSKLYSVDLGSSTISEPMVGQLDDIELGEPDWSPDGRFLVAGVRKSDGPVSRQIWLINLETKEIKQITDNYSLINAAPKWRPDGDEIVFQQAQMGTSDVKPRIAKWNKDDGNITIIANDAALPNWVP
ncbi:Ig-like domain-containing protein [Leptolinea tardivitalis]|uniref:SbsA Ig-like domain-containing protein n=1 Tax=Leptolinea tardivitalis TaxID=229920 RepID=A0A0P6X1E3_9CHLR|nr:Ig-like domain-containing protein [Leptolinea tardivitalis]KPL74739.1 hypothetical protein ADM99_01275 [Leptolinea tardivitalis]GAP22893.1 periplasmic component of the Tol biopolymer transport system [Leptolinea tardivitalis]